MPPTKFPFRLGLIAAALLASIDDAAAVGLGELRTRSHLGERFIAEVEVLTTGRETLDAGCFRLRAPLEEGGLPWLKGGSFTLRRGSPMVLEIRSDQPVREPALQVGLLVACGHEVQRDYTLLFSPRGNESAPVRPDVPPPVVQAAPQRRVAPTPVPAPAEAAPPALAKTPPAPRRQEKRAKPVPMPDRLVLSGDASPAGEATLRLSTGLAGWREKTSDALEAQREILRLEYRMLTVLAEQATTQLAAADKLRTMEETLAALRSRTDDLAGRIEKGAPVAQTAPPPVAAQPPVQAPAKAAQPEERSVFLSEWSFYGALMGAVLGIGGWLGWQQYRQRRELRLEPSYAALEPISEPAIKTPAPSQPEVDLDVGAAMPEEFRRVDMPLDYLERPDTDITVVEDHGDLLEPEAAEEESGDELPEANPVMELAEIMLSFGRVKGAAQALQEYIDHNPEEALQPWIRLMDVYRMAGMREEFERLARDLNQHFNVEIQQWEPAPREMMAPLAAFDLVLVPQGEELPPLSVEGAGSGQGLEDFEHIRQRLTELWGTDDCQEYLDHLLRDNRGGQRNGFTLPVVEEILFLMELHQTRNSLDKQTMDGEKNE